MRCNIRSVNSTLRTARALDDPYESNELKLYATDRKAGTYDPYESNELKLYATDRKAGTYDPYESNELKLYSTDRKGPSRSVRIGRTETLLYGPQGLLTIRTNRTN